MLYALIPLGMLTALTMMLAVKWKREFSDLFAPVLFSAMAVLYGCYIAGVLVWGRIALIAGCCGALVWMLLGLLGKDAGQQELHRVAFSVDFRCFLGAMAVAFLFALGKKADLIDCMRLWAAYPKALLTDPTTLQMGEVSVLYPSIQSYIPGMPLLCYFFCSFAPQFSESAVFFTYNIFLFSLMLPLIQGQHRRKVLLPAFLAMVALPWLLTSGNEDFGECYTSLFIDLPLGICCGYVLFASMHRFGRGWVENGQCMLGWCALVLLKDSGAYLAVCCILAAVVFLRRRWNGRNILCLILGALCAGALYCSWKFLRGQYTVANHLSLTAAIPSLSVLARIGWRFLSTPVVTPLLVIGSFGISLPLALMMIFGCKVLLCCHGEKENLKMEIWDIAIQVLCYIGFFLGYLSVFIHYIEEGNLPSYPRYMTTLVASALYILAADCIFRHSGMIAVFVQRFARAFPRLYREGKCIFRGLAVATLIFFTLLTLADRYALPDSVLRQAQQTAQVATEQIPAEDEDYVNLFLCVPGEEGYDPYLHHRVYFELIDDGLRVLNYYDNTNLASDSLGYTAESLLDYLINNGYDYLLLAWSTPELQERFPALFPESGENLIYRVDAQQRTLVPQSQ